MDAKDVLLDGFDRLPELVRGAVSGLTPDQLRRPPAPGANTVGWLVWHLTRVQDGHLAELRGAEQVYLSDGWAARFGRDADPSDSGYGHSPDEVLAVRPENAEALIDYYTAVHERTVAYVGKLTGADLDRVVDEAWDPPVTLGVRLV